MLHHHLAQQYIYNVFCVNPDRDPGHRRQHLHHLCIDYSSISFKLSRAPGTEELPCSHGVKWTKDLLEHRLHFRRYSTLSISRSHFLQRTHKRQHIAYAWDWDRRSWIDGPKFCLCALLFTILYHIGPYYINIACSWLNWRHFVLYDHLFFLNRHRIPILWVSPFFCIS